MSLPSGRTYDELPVPFGLLVIVAACSFVNVARGLEYAYAPYNSGAMDPQQTGWPLTEEGRAYVLKPEHERRPGREGNQHKPAMWPVVPSAGSITAAWTASSPGPACS